MTTIEPIPTHPFVIDWKASDDRDIAVCVHCGCIEAFHLHETGGTCPCPACKPGVSIEEATAMLNMLLGYNPS